MRISTILFAMVFVLTTSCKKTTDDTVQRKTDPEFETLTTYMAANQLDLSNVLDGWIVPASTVNDNLASYYVIDIRSEADYNAGHIRDAVHSTLGGILDAAANAGGKTIIVACYTGQTAAHAVVALRLSGYPDAKVLKWGMSGWTSTLSASWDNNVDTKTSASWVDAPGSIVENKEYDDPDLQVTATDGAGMLAERVQYMLSQGFKGIANGDVLDNPGGYFINNYWDEADVTTYGNIMNAHRIKPLTIAGGELKYIDPSKTVVTYCWTGQTSSMVTAYLTVLGYEAKSLKFGVNGIIYDNLQAHKWATPGTDLPLITK